MPQQSDVVPTDSADIIHGLIDFIGGLSGLLKRQAPPILAKRLIVGPHPTDIDGILGPIIDILTGIDGPMPFNPPIITERDEPSTLADAARFSDIFSRLVVSDLLSNDSESLVPGQVAYPYIPGDWPPPIITTPPELSDLATKIHDLYTPIYELIHEANDGTLPFPVSPISPEELQDFLSTLTNIARATRQFIDSPPQWAQGWLAQPSSALVKRIKFSVNFEVEITPAEIGQLILLAITL
jgi:hypothetical protein